MTHKRVTEFGIEYYAPGDFNERVEMWSLAQPGRCIWFRRLASVNLFARREVMRTYRFTPRNLARIMRLIEANEK